MSPKLLAQAWLAFWLVISSSASAQEDTLRSARLLEELVARCRARELEYLRVYGVLHYRLQHWVKGSEGKGDVQVEEATVEFWHDHPRFHSITKGSEALERDGKSMLRQPMHRLLSRDGATERVEDLIARSLTTRRELLGSEYARKNFCGIFEYVVAKTGVPYSISITDKPVRAAIDVARPNIVIVEFERFGKLKYQYCFDRARDLFPVEMRISWLNGEDWQPTSVATVELLPERFSVPTPAKIRAWNSHGDYGEGGTGRLVEIELKELHFPAHVEMPPTFRSAPVAEVDGDVASGGATDWLRARESSLITTANKAQELVGLMRGQGQGATSVHTKSLKEKYGAQVAWTAWITGALCFGFIAACRNRLGRKVIMPFAILCAVLIALGGISLGFLSRMQDNWLSRFGETGAFDAKMCGPDSLFVLCRYLGLNRIRYDGIVEVVGVNPKHGSSLRALAAAAELIEELPEAVICNESGSSQTIPDYPAILHVNRNHFILSLGNFSGVVAVIDPERGPMLIDGELLSMFMTGWRLEFPTKQRS